MPNIKSFSVECIRNLESLHFFINSIKLKEAFL